MQKDRIDRTRKYVPCAAVEWTKLVSCGVDEFISTRPGRFCQGMSQCSKWHDRVDCGGALVFFTLLQHAPTPCWKRQDYQKIRSAASDFVSMFTQRSRQSIDACQIFKGWLGGPNLTRSLWQQPDRAVQRVVRASGMVMQRQPPPPRLSSAPSIATATRPCSGSRRSPASSWPASRTSKPARSSASSVYTLCL